MGFEKLDWSLVLGGLGMFLFGIKFMGDGLKNLAGSRLREIIDKTTAHPLQAIFVGTLVTVMIQSSSATTAITIGLVRAGLMNLHQAAGIILGANIGTTITAFLIGLRVEKLALYFVFSGGLMMTLAKGKKGKTIGEILFGFGTLFYGLKIMGEALKMLKDMPFFAELAKEMGAHPLLALLVSTIFTALIQSSSAVIGIVQKLYEANALSLSAALPFVFGSNIGTTITGILAALGGSLAARRSAGLHTLFNVAGAALGMLLLRPYLFLVEALSTYFHLSAMMQIAVVHILFNLISVLLFAPWLDQLCHWVEKLITGNEKQYAGLHYDPLDETLVYELPASALNVAQNAVLKMAEAANQIAEQAAFVFKEKASAEDWELIDQMEDEINSLDKKLTHYLLLISRQNLSELQQAQLNLHLEAIKNLERIGDLSVNLTEFFEMAKEDKHDFSSEAKQEVVQMFELFFHMLKRAMDIYQDRDYLSYAALLEDENYLDTLEIKARQRHFERMRDQRCKAIIGGSVFCDILSNLERMGDHCCNIAKSAIEAKTILDHKI